MEFFDIATDALRRWQARADVRMPKVEQIRAGNAIEAESAKRIQLRLARLAASSAKPRGKLASILGQSVGGSLVESIGLERVVGRSDFLDINFIELALAVARFVGRVNILSSHGRSLGYGTGFMVSPKLLMTNNHVLTDAETARHSVVEFDYQNDRAGRMLPLASFRLDPASFFMTSAELDFSLVAVAEMSASGAPLARYGWSRLIGDEGKALLGESLNIIQHPRGEAKQIVLRSNELVDLFGHYAHYVTDTLPGSSGAPVFNDQWELVALHHAGVPKTDADGRYLAVDGSIWTEGRDPDELAWAANEGIRVSSLVEHIRRQPLTGAEAKLRDDLLMLEPPSPLEAAVLSSPAGGAASQARPSVATGGPVLTDAGATWTIPLTVSVQLGTTPPATSAAVVLGAVPASPVVALSHVAPAPGVLVSSELDEALRELERSRARPYYDQQEDARDRAVYYQTIGADADRADLFDALHRLLESTHTNRPAYNPSKHVYPWVDLQPPGDGQQIASIYSGKLFAARDLIETDFEIVRMREAMLERQRLTRLSGQEALLTIDSFEAALPFNCEHVVPQSWFGKKEPMRGDLHHLFACESGCNSFRNNIPYFDFPDFEEVVRTDCGKREVGKFEPSAGKGAVARATLYFLLRYPGEIDATSSEYTADKIEMLLRWHGTYAVTDYERHRNTAIFEKQGNRNPLIDFPEWSSQIDFLRGLK